MMNDVTWVIQSNLINLEQSKRVAQTARSLGACVQEAIVIPFSDMLGNEEEVSSLSGKVIPYGSTKLSRLAQQKKWQGACFNDDTFRTSTWSRHRSDMLNQTPFTMKVKETPHFFKDEDPQKLWFIRPVCDLKEFSGTVAPTNEIIKWMQSVYSGNFSFSEDTEVAISETKNILTESRFFIVDNKVVDGSFYRQSGQLKSKHVSDQNYIRQVQDLANIWLPHACCVMDVAETDEGLKVIEFNTINSSGFYDHDIAHVVTAMTKWCQALPHISPKAPKV